ncbi:energy transducer TonB [Spartinivicinus poritis]|uniref:energy transducer TonB n=1 Tax=Spartinivicinus poritis TaxID=2994640 RepID=UPI003CC921EB
MKAEGLRYPKYAYENNIEGSVLTEVTIDKAGNVSKIKIIESVPKGVFDKAAIRTIKTSKFTTKDSICKQDGCILTIPFLFKIK